INTGTQTYTIPNINPTPTPTSTPNPTPTPTSTPNPTPTPTLTPTPTPSPTSSPSLDLYKQKFTNLYQKLHNTANGYFSSAGIPYHSVETLICEAPDYGHETTSEALSYYIWLEVINGKLTGDWSGLQTAWTILETYLIPQQSQQPTNGDYDPTKPASYAPEFESVNNYPAIL